VSETQTPTAAQPEQAVYPRCDQCSAPVEERQRYCVSCGSRQGRAEDPVARYLAVATSRSRAAKAARPGLGGRRRAPGLGTAAVIAAIPLAVAVGVIVGRANAGGDAKLIAALRAQKAPVVNVTGGGAATSAAHAVTARTVASTFSLHKGFAVELGTLPAQSTDPAAVAKAEQAAKGKGAAAIGVINEKAFTVSPKPPGAVYILYSGQFKTKTEADAALAKLKRHFPAALVIAVRSIAGASSSSSSTGGGQVKVAATKAQLSQGANDVKQISHATGSNYVQAQNNLPGQVSIP
jgi:hypothetical protein